VVGGHASGVAAAHGPRPLGERVPDGGAATVEIDATFDLVGGGGDPPEERVGKGESQRSAFMS
jgi:hypothetical protein